MPRFHPRPPKVLRAASAPCATAPVNIGRTKKCRSQSAEGRTGKSAEGRRMSYPRIKCAKRKSEGRMQSERANPEAGDVRKCPLCAVRANLKKRTHRKEKGRSQNAECRMQTRPGNVQPRAPRCYWALPGVTTHAN